MKISKEYAVLVINTRERQGQASEALAGSLFHKLKILAAKSSSLSVSIHNVISDSMQATSLSVSVESSRSIKRFLVKEFFLPPTPGLSTRNYLLWIFRAPVRTAVYSWHKLRHIWREAASTGQKSSLIWRIPFEVFLIAMDTFFFAYVTPLISLTVTHPLRKMGNLALSLWLFVIVFILVLLTWKQTVPPFISWISQITHQLINLVPDSGVTFYIFFPVMASLFLGIALTYIIALLIKILRWLVPSPTISQERNLRTMESPLSYLLDPVYASRVRDDFERKLIDLNNDTNVQCIFVVCQDTGVLLAYEVLSRACRGKIIKPVYLLTRNNLSVAGFMASPISSLWILVDHVYWDRFSQTTPKNLSWRHLTGWPVYEYTFKLISRYPHTIPQVQRRHKNHTWSKGTNTVLVDRLIALTKLVQLNAKTS